MTIVEITTRVNVGHYKRDNVVTLSLEAAHSIRSGRTCKGDLEENADKEENQYTESVRSQGEWCVQLCQNVFAI